MGHAYDYDRNRVSKLCDAILTQQCGQQEQNWLEQRKKILEDTGAVQQFNLTFTAIPRFTGRHTIAVPPDDVRTFQETAHGFFVQGITLDRLARTWWLLQWPADNKERYVQTIEGLFNAAEMNELVALYSALPLLAWPEEWKMRTAEGVRSNIGTVLEAIMLHNSYPARYLDEPAWNQLVLKAFFTEKPVHEIIGLDEKANAHLAAILVDYAHERWAAGRSVNPMLWRLVAPFIDAASMPDIERVWHSENNIEKEAAALACYHSVYEPAQALLQRSPALTQEIAAGKLNWNRVAEKL